MTRLLIALLLCLSLAAGARVRTTQTHLTTNAAIVPDIALADTLAPDSAAIPAGAVTLRGFYKRASDTRESFFVTSHLPSRISAVRILLRYTTLDGTMLTERQLSIPVDLQPGQSKMVTVPSFDKQRAFYFHAGPRPRKNATPFQVAFRLLGYDIPVGK